MRNRVGCVLGGAAAALVLLLPTLAHPQPQYVAGQNVVPVFEGWERLPDGSFDMVFGYMNRSYEDELDIPVGADNNFAPGGDQRQPTHFYTRRQQFVFRVRVPKDWDKKELVWTLTSRGRTEKAYGTLLSFWEVNNMVYQQNRGGPADLETEDASNQAPTIRLVGAAQRTVRVAEPFTLTVEVTDDDRPPPRGGGAAASGRGGAGAGSGPRRESPIAQAMVRLDPGVRLGVTWVLYRGGPGPVAFEPVRGPVVGGKAETRVSFSKPGTYQIRAYADDGVLVTPADVTVSVAPGTPR